MTIEPKEPPSKLNTEGLRAHVAALDEERRLLLKALAKSEDNFRRIIATSPVGISISRVRDGLILDMNREFLRILGFERYEAIGRTSSKLGIWVHDDQRDTIVREFREQGRFLPREIQMRRKGGEVITVLFSASPIAIGEEPHVISWVVDISDRIATEAALQAGEQRFRDLVHSMNDWVWEVDPLGNCTYCSDRVEEVLGISAAAMIGNNPLSTLVPEEQERINKIMSDLFKSPKAYRDVEAWHVRPDGRRVYLSISGIPRYNIGGGFQGYRGVARDLTSRKREEEERRRMEDEVHQARRVEGLGVLAGGIAHDFNNLLSAVLGNAEIALGEVPAGSPVHPLLERIQTAALHAAELTRQMLAYAGRGRHVTERVDLSVVVHEIRQLLAALITKNIDLSFDLAEGLPSVEADPAQLRQVVMNLVINAAEAIGENQGRIKVRTAVQTPSDSWTPDFTIGAVTPGMDVALLEVSDTGCGMETNTLGRIFDPFFSMKFAGRGLGLAAVQGIVLRHGGAVMVMSRPDEGSVFRVFFPAAMTARTASPPAAIPVADKFVSGAGAILVVDDEEPVRAVAQRMLRILGFEALAAANGRETLEILASDGRIRAILLDLTLPRMDGREILLEIRRLRGNIPVILCTGYDVIQSAERFPDQNLSGFLQKPYRIKELSQALSIALGAVEGNR